MPKPPNYTLWEAIMIAIELGQKALEEIRVLARLPGPAGKDGRDGVDGKDGRDGLGIDSIKAEQLDDGRFIKFLCYGGSKLIQEITLQQRSVIYRGVFDPQKHYLPGDQVSWQGSGWHCNKEVVGQIGTEHWSLMIKRGRDGKDGGGS